MNAASSRRRLVLGGLLVLLAVIQMSMQLKSVQGLPRGNLMGNVDSSARTTRNITRELIELTSLKNAQCAEGLRLITNKILVETDEGKTRRIPRVIHTTARTRCVTPAFWDNLQKWQSLPGYSFFLHDDAAIDTLLEKRWPELPNLRLLMPCLLAGAALADLYRYLLLYEYGGIYTDMDNAPGSILMSEWNAISPDHDAVLTREGGGFPSQYWMAMSPKHPLMYLAIQSTFTTILGLGNIRRQYVPLTTGPGRLVEAWTIFVGDFAARKPWPGTYVGLQNRSATIIRGARNESDYVVRNAIGKNQKRLQWNSTGQVVFQDPKNHPPPSAEESLSCLEAIQENHFGQRLIRRPPVMTINGHVGDAR